MIPKLMGCSEIAELFGVKTQRINQLMTTKLRKKHVPHMQRLRMGPVFLGSEVMEFKTVWTRSPGRPQGDTT